MTAVSTTSGCSIAAQISVPAVEIKMTKGKGFKLSIWKNLVTFTQVILRFI